MVRSRDEPPAVRVYTVCDESKYLIARNVPALGCGDGLMNLFSRYGEVEEAPIDRVSSDQSLHLSPKVPKDMNLPWNLLYGTKLVQLMAPVPGQSGKGKLEN